MGYASRAGRARTSASNPQAHAICDRCGFRYNLVSLRWQMDWAGASLVNKRLLVCDTCYDVPQEQLRAIAIPADPVPVINPRPQDFVTAETDYRVTSDGDTRITQSDQTRVSQQTGEPPGGLNTQPGTSITVPDDAGGADPGLPYGNTSVPETGPL